MDSKIDNNPANRIAADPELAAKMISEGILTPEVAQELGFTFDPLVAAAQKKRALKNDQDFVRRYLAGNLEARGEMGRLDYILSNPEDFLAPQGSPREAVQSLERRKADPDFVAKYLAGDAEAVKEMDRLHGVIAGEITGGVT